MDTTTEGAILRENIGWMTEAHRLSLGSDRSRKAPPAASKANHLDQVALPPCQHGNIATVPIPQPVIRWLSTLNICSG
ncbi:MAG TPA: hypothetical protein VH023_21615 [Rhodopila sp.]|jgi:hypothetical protein|nr:hypothetical protein [Rhodopila sp.]